MEEEQSSIKLPLYAKVSLILMSLCIILTSLYFGKHILIPLLLSLLFAILLRPVVVFFNKNLKFPHVIAVLTAVILFVIFVAGIIFFISWQVADITHDWNKIKHNISVHYEHLQHWIKQRYHLSYNKQEKYIQQVRNESINGNSELMSNTLSSFTDTLLNTVLIPIYTFLILLYRNLFIKFLTKMVHKSKEHILKDILTQIKTVIQSYIVGLLIEMGIVGTLTTVGLMLLGVEYAVLLGVITAILNLIPYIGILVASVVTILATLVNSSQLSVIMGAIALSIFVQFIDNNILVPKIIGNKVRINALVSIVGVVIGGAIAGVAGMFLAIPMIAILKVIFDRIEALSPWGFLMGDELPKTYKWRNLQLTDFSQGNNREEEPSKINENNLSENISDPNNIISK